MSRRVLKPKAIVLSRTASAQRVRRRLASALRRAPKGRLVQPLHDRSAQYWEIYARARTVRRRFAPWSTSREHRRRLLCDERQRPVDSGRRFVRREQRPPLCGCASTPIRSLVFAFSPSTDYHGIYRHPGCRSKRITGPLLIFHQKGDKIAGDGPATLDRIASGSERP